VRRRGKDHPRRNWLIRSGAPATKAPDLRGLALSSPGGVAAGIWFTSIAHPRDTMPPSIAGTRRQCWHFTLGPSFRPPAPACAASPQRLSSSRGGVAPSRNSPLWTALPYGLAPSVAVDAACVAVGPICGKRPAAALFESPRATPCRHPSWKQTTAAGITLRVARSTRRPARLHLSSLIQPAAGSRSLIHNPIPLEELTDRDRRRPNACLSLTRSLFAIGSIGMAA
jgi:hypothetical protein